LVGSFLVLWAFQVLTVYSQQAALLLMGVMLLCTVVVAPQGFAIGIVQGMRRLIRGRAVHRSGPGEREIKA